MQGKVEPEAFVSVLLFDCTPMAQQWEHLHTLIIAKYLCWVLLGLETSLVYFWFHRALYIKKTKCEQ